MRRCCHNSDVHRGLEQPAQHKASEQDAAVGNSQLPDNELTVTDEPSSLLLGTPEFIRVATELRRTTQLYSARENAWTTEHRNATANNTRADNIPTGVTVALHKSTHFTSCIRAAALGGVLLATILQNFVHAADRETSQTYHSAFPTSNSDNVDLVNVP